MPKDRLLDVRLAAVIPRAPYVISFRHPGDHTVMTQTGSLSHLEAVIIRLRLHSAQQKGLIEEGRILPADQPPSDFQRLSQSIPGWESEQGIDATISTATTLGQE